ncbi:hypothetical protein TNCV_108201 [Trichonephila clavipes]|nr:hypothetical protein TNCV_108201 [Trichonephila clavipes]
MMVPVVQSVSGPCNARFTAWLSGAADLREYHCSMLVIGLHVLPGQESTETEVLRTGNESHGVINLDSDYFTPTGG